MVDEKGFKFVKPEIMNQRLIQGLEDLQDLYAMELDQLIVVAMHYKWNPDSMQEWLIKQDTLKYALGLEFDTKIAQLHPETNASRSSENGGYCIICYNELGASTSFALGCGHTFCNECW